MYWNLYFFNLIEIYVYKFKKKTARILVYDGFFYSFFCFCAANVYWSIEMRYFELHILDVCSQHESAGGESVFL